MKPQVQKVARAALGTAAVTGWGYVMFKFPNPMDLQFGQIAARASNKRDAEKQAEQRRPTR
jgi:hypothetical protein